MTKRIQHDWTRKMEALERENRRLVAALKAAADPEPTEAVVSAALAIGKICDALEEQRAVLRRFALRCNAPDLRGEVRP